MSCEKYKNVIEKYLDGIIADSELADLKIHIETCRPCQGEFRRCVLIQTTIKQAFSPRLPAEQVKATVLQKLFTQPNRHDRRTGYGIASFAGKRLAIAAGILLTVGLLLGFALGRAGNARTTAPLAAKVPVRVANLEGTVLVRHKGSNVWQILEAGSSVYLGDTFHSTAKSAFVLELEDKSTLELSQNSMLVLKLHNGGTQFHLEHGKLAAALNSPHPPFVISTPHGRVEALGTEFTVTVE